MGIEKRNTWRRNRWKGIGGEKEGEQVEGIGGEKEEENKKWIGNRWREGREWVERGKGEKLRGRGEKNRESRSRKRKSI